MTGLAAVASSAKATAIEPVMMFRIVETPKAKVPYGVALAAHAYTCACGTRLGAVGKAVERDVTGMRRC